MIGYSSLEARAADIYVTLDEPQLRGVWVFILWGWGASCLNPRPLFA